MIRREDGELEEIPAANDREAAFITGRLLDEGICVQPDPVNAAHFFGRAAQPSRGHLRDPEKPTNENVFVV